MPTYEYFCSNCGAEFERLLKIAEMHLPTEEPCPGCQAQGSVQKTIAGAPSLGDPVRLGVRRIDNGFKEVLQKIHERSPRSNLDQKF